MEININTNNNDNEKSGGFVGAMARGFDKFIGLFKKHGILYSIIFLLVFVVFYSLIIHPINIDNIVTEVLKREDKIKIERQEKSIDQRIEADHMINELMTELVDNFNINRCMLFEIHNGSANISNLEYLFYSATSEIINTNNTQGEDVYELEYQADNFQRQHISNFLGQVTYNRLKHENYLYFSNIEQYHRQSYRFISKMKDIGAKSVMIIPFVTHNIPSILLVLSSKDPVMDAAAIYTHVQKYETKIEKNLTFIEEE